MKKIKQMNLKTVPISKDIHKKVVDFANNRGLKIYTAVEILIKAGLEEAQK